MSSVPEAARKRRSPSALRLGVATSVSILCLVLHSGGWMDMGFLNPSHLQGCAVTPVFLKTIDIPIGTRQTMILESQTDPAKIVKIFASARVSMQLQGEDGPRGPYYFGGYLPERDVLILGDIKGHPYEVAVTEITKLMVAPTNPVGHGAQRGALVAGGATAVVFFWLGPCVPLVAAPAGVVGSAVGAALGTTSAYESEYLIGPKNWRVVRDYRPSRHPDRRPLTPEGRGG